MTLRNYRLAAVLWAGLMLVLGVGATRGETATLLKGSFRGQAYAATALATTDAFKNRVGKAALVVIG